MVGIDNQAKIGVAVIGTGFGRKVHIPGFIAHPRTEVVAVYHRDLDTATAIASLTSRYAAAHNIPQASDNIAEIVALPSVDAVSISTPPFLHYEMAKTVLQAGKHLLLEKPLTLNVAQAKQLYQLTQTTGAIATVDFEFRFVPAWQMLAEMLEIQHVGQKRLIKIDWLVSGRADATRPWNWYSQVDCGGGALGALGSHTFDYIHWLFGPVSRLNARLSTAIRQRPDPTTGELKLVDTDDTCMLMLELADGTPCQVNISTAVYAPRTHWLEVYGDRGTLVLGSENQKDYIHGFRLWGAMAGQKEAEIEIPNRLIFPKNYADGRISAFIRVVDQWVQAIDCQTNPLPSLREGVYSQLLMDLAHESDATSSWVDVPDVDEFLEEA